MEIISTISLININETLIVQLVSFLAFLFIINRVMFRPLQRTVDERDAYMREVRLEIEGSEKEIEKMTDDIRAQESAVRSQALELSRKIEDSGTEALDETIAAAREKIMARTEETRMVISDQLADAVKEVKTESESLADRIMEKLLDRELS